MAAELLGDKSASQSSLELSHPWISGPQSAKDCDTLTSIERYDHCKMYLAIGWSSMRAALTSQESPRQTKPKKAPKGKVHEFRPFL